MRETNRRKDARAKTSVRFWYRMPWSREWVGARTEDIGLGGMSFVLPSGLCFKGLPIEVAVEAPAAAFRSRSRVVTTRKNADGRVVSLSFDALPQQQANRLRTFVNRARFAEEAALSA